MAASRLYTRTALLAGILILAGGCAGSGGGSAPSAGSSSPGLLSGNSLSSASAALPTVAPVPAPAADISGEALLSRISIVLSRTATIGQLNAAALKIGATGFAYAKANSPYLTVIIPHQSSAAVLDTLAQSLRGQPGILLAVAGRRLASKVLPSKNGSSEPVDELDHLLATGFPAAWNASKLARQNCASRPVTIVIPDTFIGPPDQELLTSQLPGHAGEFADASSISVTSPTAEDLHGFDVASIVGAQFDTIRPTGANPFPECLKFVPVNLAALDVFQSIEAIREAVQGSGGKVILNASVGFSIARCGPAHDQACVIADVNTALVPFMQDEIATRFAAGIDWAQSAMQPDVLDDALLSQAAGNEADETTDNGVLGVLYAGLRRARLASPLAIATQLPSLQSILGEADLWSSPQPGLPSFSLDPAMIADLQGEFISQVTDAVSDRNFTAVGSTTNASLLGNLALSTFSNDGADLMAVGENVTGVASILKGTSFTAPQVTGLAAYLWLLDPTLAAAPVAETLKLIRATSRSTTSVSNVIDAYGAVLALDARNHNQLIRKALLDVNGDGVFDAQDLQQYAQAYGLGNSSTPAVPTDRDYSRYDLNGDGLTGGIATERFDLDAGDVDANGAPVFGSVDEVIEGYHLTFNEAALSDLQILCYYAYSPLYVLDGAGQNAQLRTSLLGPDRCVGARMNVQLPAHITSSSTLLTVTVQIPGASGQLVPAANMLVDLIPSCATASPISGRTDAAGVITATVTPTSGCTQVSVTVIARGDTGTTALAQQVVTATVSSGPITLSGSVSIHRNLDTSFDQLMSFTMTVTVGTNTTVGTDGLTVTQISGTFSETYPQTADGCPTLTVTDAQIVSGQFRVVGSTHDFGFGATGTVTGTNIWTGQLDANGNPICGGSDTEPETTGFNEIPYTIVRASDGHITALDFTSSSSILDSDPPPLFLHYNATGEITERP